MMRPLRVAAAAIGASVLLLLATGCATTDARSASAGEAAPTGSTGPAATVTVTDPWVKAADKGMTAAFATLTNGTDRELTVVAASCAAAPTVELHEVAMADGKMVMRPKAGGIVVPAHGSHQLKPGGDHLMLLAMTKPVRPGDRIPFTLRLSDGTSVAFTAVAKDFAGGNENYQPGAGSSPQAGMTPGGHG